ncbi:hypothetical protein Tco_0713907 [Tanacetum coccineum]
MVPKFRCESLRYHKHDFVEVALDMRQTGKEAAIFEMEIANDDFTEVQKKNNGSKSGSNAASTSGTTKVGNNHKVPSPPRAKSDLTTLVSNPFDVLNAVEENACDLSDQNTKKASLSMSQDDSDDESEVEEYPLYDSIGISSIGGNFSLEDDDLDCYDGYEAHVYNLSGKSQAFVIIMISV